jgi:hypothetical protein
MMSAEVARRFPKYTLEHAIELGQRLKANIVGDFADSAVRIQKLCSGVLQPDTRHVVRKFQSGAGAASDMGRELLPVEFVVNAYFVPDP